ncbi:MAG: hypothetical protein E7635_00530 [Ruminococcaceae bacterium]|nr:hypothetical protein [Oscillospiraceae bacterium]
MKKIALILALIFVLTPVLVACNGDNGAENNTSAQSSDNSEYEYSLDDLPTIDFEKKKFGFYGGKNTSGRSFGFIDAETGDIFEDAVFQRQVLIEDRYNLSILRGSSAQESANHIASVRNLILADDKTYHVMSMITSDPAFQLVYDGYFTDWYEFEHFDPSKPYWNKSVAENLNYGGKVYCMAGDISLGTYNYTNCIQFNKKLFDDLGIDYPYQDVYDYTWTIDKLIEISKQGYNDLNGNTEWDIDSDRFGFMGWGWEMNLALYMGMGGNSIVNDEDQMPALDINNTRTVKIIDKMIELFDKKNAHTEMSTYGVHNTAFNEGRLLMRDTFLFWLETNRELEFDAGILPYPMLDEDQGEYICRSAANCCGAYWVPTTNNDLAATGVILEALAIEGYNKLRPIYYDVHLDLKSAPDEETIDMVDIIFDSAEYINENFINSSSFSTFISNQFNSFASWYANNERPFRRQMKEMTAFYGA